MRFLLSTAGATWHTAADQQENGSATSDAQARAHWQSFMREVLAAENLVVLSGSGTSLGLKPVSGPSMGDLWTAARERAGDSFAAVIEKVGYVATAVSGDDIERLLSRCHLFQELHGHDSEIDSFVEQTEALIVERCRFVDVASGTPALDAHTAFLRGAAQRLPRMPRMKLFTTNYDLCWEAAASHARFVVVDGFSHTVPQEFDGVHFSYDIVHRDRDREAPDYIANVFHLYKMHGSVDWHRAEGQHRIVRRSDAEKPLLIYPRESKFKSSYDQPFFELVSRFQMALRQQNVALLVLGFGFNDHHLVQPIETALASNSSFRMLVVDPAVTRGVAGETDPDSEPHPMIRRLWELINRGDRRIGLLKATFRNFADALPDLTQPGEADEHRRRVHVDRVFAR